MATRRLTYMDSLAPQPNPSIMPVSCPIIDDAARELPWQSTTPFRARWYEIAITLDVLNSKLEQIAEVRSSARFRKSMLLAGKD
jgi:hypothetical protein